MELWIRSQDKEALIKVDKIFYWNTCPEMPSAGKHYLGNKEWIGNTDYTKLGEYATKERALEVLDEIQKQIYNCGKSVIETDDNGIPSNLKYYSNVYEMPKE